MRKEVLETGKTLDDAINLACEKLGVSQLLGGGGGAAPARQGFRDDEAEIADVAFHQEITRHSPQKQDDENDEYVPGHGPHAFGKIAAYEFGHISEQALAGGVDGEIGPKGQIFQIQNEPPVQNDVPGHGIDRCYLPKLVLTKK